MGARTASQRLSPYIPDGRVDDVLSGPTTSSNRTIQGRPGRMSDKLGEVYGVTLTTLKSGPPEAHPSPARRASESAETPTFQADQVKQL